LKTPVRHSLILGAIPLILLLLSVQVSVAAGSISGTSRSNSNTSNTTAVCAKSELASINTDSLAAIAEANASFQMLSSGSNTYSVQAIGVQAGYSCSAILMFSDTRGASIEVIFNPNNSIAKMVYSPPSNETFTGSGDAWAGYETYRCPSTGCGKVTLAAAQVDFTVPSFQKPTSYENGNCCLDALWAGLGDASGASDNVLTQGGVAVWGDHQSVTGYTSPAFWYQQLTAGPHFWTSTCLYVNSGDDVNVTVAHGAFGSGGSYDIEIVYSDNDSSSTCAVYWFLNYSITPTYAYSIYEAAKSTGCSYNGEYCQTIQFNTLTYYAYVHYSGAGWDGYAAGPSGIYSGYVQYDANWYISQGTTNVDIDC